ncbi:MAG: 3-hexulose-6-phosphate synthase [Clostridia bacterium]|nr:3-hexulose-6-phosphate synthase [Clostridia bacterium]MBQ6325289.1 3-hexulose-6-phosphate synthase [Clostridia bacterium]
MKLQLALDDLSLEEAIALVARVREHVDIIEAGTPLIYGYGMEAVRALKARFPEKQVLADMKIMDSGAWETEEAMTAGADYVTVLGVSEDATVRNCLETATRYGREVVVDMICVPDLPGRIRQLEALGVQGLAVHTGVDQQAAGRTPLDDLRLMTACAQRAKISVAGGIRPDTVAEYAAYRPEVVIVGGGILHAPDPVAAAAAIARQLRAFE